MRLPVSWVVKPPGVAAGDASRSEAEPSEDPLPVSTRGTLTDADPVPPAPQVAVPGPVEPLSGDLSVQVWSPKGQGPKQGWRVEDPESLPVMNGEQVHLQVRLNRAAYVYVLWVTSEGKVLPLYPWTAPKLGFASPLPDPTPTTVVDCPAQLDGGWPVTGVSGLESAFLLRATRPCRGTSRWSGRSASSRPPGTSTRAKSSGWSTRRAGRSPAGPTPIIVTSASTSRNGSMTPS